MKIGHVGFWNEKKSKVDYFDKKPLFNKEIAVSILGTVIIMVIVAYFSLNFYLEMRAIPRGIELFEMSFPQGMMKGTNGKDIKKVWLVTARLGNSQMVEYYDDTETIEQKAINNKDPKNVGEATW